MAGHSKPFASQETIASDRGFFPEPSPVSQSSPLDAASALSSLRDAISAGYHGLDPILEAITEAARILTDASGAALAMWRDGTVVCRARSGELSPALGAQLDAETGISGECLRTGKIQHCTDAEADPRVDAAACRSRGLRSIAVLPIRSRRNTNGILLAFSTQPAAFTDLQIAVLQQLASLAELARAAKLQSVPVAAAEPAPGEPDPADYVLPLAASSTLASHFNADPPKLHPQSPAPDRRSDVALGFLQYRFPGFLQYRSEDRPAYRSRPVVLGAIALVAAALLTLAIWLGWRGPQHAESRAHLRSPRSPATAIGAANAAAAASTERGGQHFPDNDTVWAPNPGGESLPAFGNKTAVDDSVKLAAQLDKAASVTASIIISDRVPRTQPGPTRASRPESKSELPPAEVASAEAPPLPPDSTTRSDVSDMNAVLSAKVTLPEPPARLSQGVSGGQLLSSILPEYPAAARRLRLEGEVVLLATVMEDGTVGDIKVVKGSPLLAQSAVDAVKNWRYQPYQLNGQPVKNDTKIVVDFTLPSVPATR